MEKKKKFPIGKILFVILYIFMVAIFMSTAIDFGTKAKYSKYYTEDVFPTYRDYEGSNDEYLDELVKYYHGYYDKENPIFEETITAEQTTDENPLQFDLKIYRARFKITEKKFLFFTKTYTTDAYIIQFKDIMYGTKDLVKAGTRKDATYDLQDVPEILKIKLSYNQALDAKSKNAGANYEDYIDPARPFIFIANNLKLQDNTMASVTSLSVVREVFPPKAAKDGTVERDLNAKPEVEYLYSATAPGHAPIGGEKVHRNDPETNPFEINSETMKFEDESQIKLEKADVSKYNNKMVAPIVIAVILSLVFGYFMFFHRLVKEKIAEKRTEKAIAARQKKDAQSGIIQDDLGDAAVIEGDFEEVSEEETPEEEPQDTPEEDGSEGEPSDEIESNHEE